MAWITVPSQNHNPSLPHRQDVRIKPHSRAPRLSGRYSGALAPSKRCDGDADRHRLRICDAFDNHRHGQHHHLCLPVDGKLSLTYDIASRDGPIRRQSDQWPSGGITQPKSSSIDDAERQYLRHNAGQAHNRERSRHVCPRASSRGQHELQSGIVDGSSKVTHACSFADIHLAPSISIPNTR